MPLRYVLFVTFVNSLTLHNFCVTTVIIVFMIQRGREGIMGEMWSSKLKSQISKIQLKTKIFLLFRFLLTAFVVVLLIVASGFFLPSARADELMDIAKQIEDLTRARELSEAA